MSFFKNNFLTRIFLSSNKRTRNSQSKASNDYATLESRRVLASIFLDSSGELFISGGDGNDVGALVASGDQVEASISGARARHST